jgi:predicted MPP superfamily phosphohydrolase
VLAGVDDVLWGMPDLAASLRGAPDDAPVLLMAHEPDYAPAAAENPRVVLQLSGHAHGGQIRPPGLPPLILPDLGRRYPEGAYRVGGMALYVSRGIGTGRVTLRFNCRPEIAVITLVRGDAARGVEWIGGGEGV